MLRRRVPVVLQLAAGECGAACLAMVLSYHGRRTRLSECRALLPIGRDGATARMMRDAAISLGADAKALSIDDEAFETLPLPVIAHWKFNHFVVVEKRSASSVEIVDPAEGRIALSREEFGNAFTGVVLAIGPSRHHVDIQKGRERRWGHYLSHVSGRRMSVLLVLGCSFVLQVVGLAVPLMTAFVVDRLLPAHDEALLPVLVFAALMLVLNQFTISNLRERLLLHLRADLTGRVTSDFLKHALALPLSFFDRRGTGDLLGRLASNAMIKETLSAPVVSAVLDGTFAIVYLVILLTQDPSFALIVVVLGAAQALTALMITPRLNLRYQRELSARAESYDYVAQAFSGITTLKASGGEERALANWAPMLAREISATADVDRLHAVMATVSSSVRLLSPLTLLLLGTYQVLNGALTLGVMFALIALGMAFLTPIGSLVADIQEIQRASAHIDRLADVLNSPVEQVDDPRLLRRKVGGAVELRNVCFAYEPGASPVLDGISLRIAAGAKLAVVGRSGSGKSTLAKVLLGLYRPMSGEVLYDDCPLEQYNLLSLRHQFGVVLQEAALFSGSIRDNIAFHCPDASLDRVMDAARAAAIDDEIMAMPLRYETPVMQLGAGISGGQRQRIALARALARRPVVLVLDEATSHLDAVTEREIDAHLSQMGCTRIVIAHRLSTIRDATEIVVLDSGAIVERGTHDNLVANRGWYWNLVRRQLGADHRQAVPVTGV